MSNGFLYIILAISILILFTIGNIAINQRDDLKREALKRGYAEFIPNEFGTPVFQWK